MQQQVAGSLGQKVVSTYQYGKRAVTWGGDHKELIEIIGCLTQIPGVLAIDSENALAIKAAALLDLAVIDAKILKDLFKNQTGCLAQHCIYNIPKVLAYILAARYDHLRLTATPKKAKPGSPEAQKLRSLKMTQFFQLGVEVLFRVFAYVDALDLAKTGHSNLAEYLSEAADWVQLWRLLNRLNVLAEQDATLQAQLEADKQKISQIFGALCK